jgi:hypothetical protein
MSQLTLGSQFNIFRGIFLFQIVWIVKTFIDVARQLQLVWNPSRAGDICDRAPAQNQA